MPRLIFSFALSLIMFSAVTLNAEGDFPAPDEKAAEPSSSGENSPQWIKAAKEAKADKKFLIIDTIWSKSFEKSPGLKAFKTVLTDP